MARVVQSDHHTQSIPKFEQIACQEDITWVQELVQKYPELNWFSTYSISQSLEEKDEHRYSMRMFQKQVPEFDRAIMSIYCLQTFLKGKYEDYLEFVSHQARTSQLEWQSFIMNQNHIQGIMTRVPNIKERELIHLFEFAIIFNEVFKSGILQKKLEELGLKSKEYKDVVLEAIQHIEQLFPSYQYLSTYQQELFSQIILTINFDQIIRLEGGPEMFSSLKQSAIIDKNPLSFEMGFFIYSCGVAGTLGHVNQRSSLMYTEDLHKCLMAVRSACYLLKDQTELAAYNYYLSMRATWLGLDAGSPLHRVLTRIGAMLMLYKPEEGKILKESLLKLAAEDLALVVEEFNANRKEMRYCISTCLPSVLINLANNAMLGDVQRERLEQTIRIGLPFLAKVLKFQKDAAHRHEIEGGLPLNFDQIAKVAEDSPEHLKERSFQVDEEGNVTLAQ